MADADSILTRQVRKAVADINLSLDHGRYEQARFELTCLRYMLDAPVGQRKPWSYYQPRVKEEFENDPQTAAGPAGQEGRAPTGDEGD